MDYELQCRVKNSTGVAPKWYSPSTSAPPTHPTMKLALRSAARTATLSGLTTYCDPLAFRVRMIHRTQDSDEASGAKRKSSLRKSAWSDTSDWMQTSPNKPARPTSLQQDDEFTSSTSIGVYWSAPQDNGAAISSYTLVAAREDGKEFTVYIGTDTKCVVGKPSPAAAFAHTPALALQLAAPHTLAKPNPTRIRVRPGETLLFRLTATNSVGDSVPSSVVAMRALPNTEPPKSSGGRGGGPRTFSPPPHPILHHPESPQQHLLFGRAMHSTCGNETCVRCAGARHAFVVLVDDWDACQNV